MSGWPCVAGRFGSSGDGTICGMLIKGMTEQEILADYPELEGDDFRAVYDFAAHMGKPVPL